MIDRIDHAAIVVTDLNRSIDFYTQVLGFRVGRQLQFSDRDLVILELGEAPAAKLELLRYDATDPSRPVPEDRALLGLRHLALHVQDVDATFHHLTEAGVEMLPDPPYRRTDGPPIAFGYDPDGVLLEFTEID